MRINDSYKIAVSIFSFSETLADLRNKEYTQKFRRDADCLFCIGLYVWIFPDQFSVDASFYFEDKANPDANRIVYAISTTTGIKGTMVDQVDVYADNISPWLIEKLGHENLRKLGSGENSQPIKNKKIKETQKTIMYEKL